MQYWFTADTHLGHNNILKYCNRPFSSIREHDGTIISNLNFCVQEKDHLYLLGDIFFTSPLNYLEKIRCKNLYFIIGSHDKHIDQYMEYYRKVDRKLVETINEQTIIMSHYPFLSWDRSHYGTWHLFGHHHGRLGNLSTQFANDPYVQATHLIIERAKMIDVGVDTNNYFPYSFDDIKKIMEGKAGFLVHKERQ